MTRYLRRFIPLLLTCFAFLSHNTLAEPAPPAEGSKQESKTPKKETIEVKSTGEYDARRDDTATKIVVNSAEIMKNGDTQVLDVLKRLPGITVTGSAVRMRGLSQGYTQILVDGERPPPGFTLDNLSPALIERIEIVRAATAEFSTQSIAGTINIVLKKKVTFSQRDLRMSYMQSQYFRSSNLNFVLSDKVDNLGYTLSGSVYNSRLNFESASTEVSRDAAGNLLLSRSGSSSSGGSGEGFNLAPRLVWSWPDGDSLNVQGFFNQSRGTGTGQFAYHVAEGTQVPVTSNVSANEYDNQFHRLDVNWIKKLAGGGKLDLKLGTSESSFTNVFAQRGFNASNVMNLERTSKTGAADHTLTMVGKLTQPLGDGHSFVTGWDVSQTQRDQSNSQQDVPIVGVFPIVPAFNSDERFDATVTKTAAFAQDEWNVTKAWSVYLGIRWEGIRTQSEGSGFERSESRSSVWTPLFQTLYKLPDRPGEQVRFALTRTYKAPTTANLIPRRFTSIDNRPTGPDRTGNPTLQPELATGLDMAYEKFWGNSGSWSIAASARRITGYNRTGLLFVDGRWLSLPINDGNATTRSVEFDTKFPVQSVWKAGPPLDLRFNLSRHWSHVSVIPGPNNRLDAQTPLSSTFGWDYRMQGGVIVAGGSISYRRGGEVRTSETQTKLTSSRRDLDIYGLWKITPKIQVRLTLANLLRVAERTDLTYTDATLSTVQGSSQPSRLSVRANLELKL